LRSSLMLLPDLLIAHRLTGKPHYLEFYRRVIARFKDNPDRARDTGPFSLERLARVNHSSEGQSYEALYNLIRYEKNPELLNIYRKWVEELWEMNWMEGNSLFTWMTGALLPEYRAPKKSGMASTAAAEIPHGEEAWPGTDRRWAGRQQKPLREGGISRHRLLGSSPIVPVTGLALAPRRRRQAAGAPRRARTLHAPLDSSFLTARSVEATSSLFPFLRQISYPTCRAAKTPR